MKTFLRFLAILCVLFFAKSANSTTYYVATSGSDSNAGTTEAAPWAHLPQMKGALRRSIKPLSCGRRCLRSSWLRCLVQLEFSFVVQSWRSIRKPGQGRRGPDLVQFNVLRLESAHLRRPHIGGIEHADSDRWNHDGLRLRRRKYFHAV